MRLILLSLVLLVGGCKMQEDCAAYAEGETTNEPIIAAQMPQNQKCDNKKCELCYPKKYLNKD